MAAGEVYLPIDVESDYDELVVTVKKATLGEKARNNMKDCQLRRRQQKMILRAVSALLKCSGGVVKKEHCFLIFVKSGITGRQYGTLSTNLYRRNVTCTDEMNEATASEFLKELKRTEGRLYSTPTLPAERACIDESHSEDLAAAFFNSRILTQNEEFHFTESTHVEIKSFLTRKSLQRIKEILPKNVSAFANTDGGYLFIGLNGETQKIIGFKADKRDLTTLEKEIEKCIRKLPVYHCCKEKTINYTCKFLEVHDENGLCGYVCTIRIERFCCAVFAEYPDSWHVKDNCVVQMTSTEWVDFMMDGEYS
ncbi:ribonuclease SLFN12 [Erethizon dorsatum]